MKEEARGKIEEEEEEEEEDPSRDPKPTHSTPNVGRPTFGRPAQAFRGRKTLAPHPFLYRLQENVSRLPRALDNFM